MESKEYKFRCPHCNFAGRTKTGSPEFNAMLVMEYMCEGCGVTDYMNLTPADAWKTSWSEDAVKRETDAFYGAWFLWLETDEGKIAQKKARYNL